MSSSRQQQRLKMKKHLQVVAASNKEDDEAWDSDGSLSWEDFFGNSSTTDLVPTLLGMYDALIGRADADNTPKDKSQGKIQKQESSEVPSNKFPVNPDPPPPPAEPPPSECQQETTPPKDFPETIAADNEGHSLQTMDETSQPWKEVLGNSREPSSSPNSHQQLLPYHRSKGNEERPLSVTSTASSSSTTSSSSSSSGGRDRGRSKSCAYLASVESLGDDEMSLGDEEEGVEKARKGVRSNVSIDDHRGNKCVTVDSGAAKGFSCGASRIQRGHHSYPHHHNHREQHLLGGGSRRLFLSHNQSNSAATTSNKSSSGVSSVTSSSSSSSSYSSFPTATCSHISPPSLPTGPKPRYCDPNLSYMDRVVMEIAETEAIYVRDLQQVIEGYLHRWRSSSDCPIGSRQLRDLFGNIEDIYLFNSEFLCELQQCGMDPVKVAKTFVKNNSGFSIYTEYCTNYPRTVSVLTELMRQEMTVRLFRERQAALQHTLPLGSYLLKPVQRILKYHLLLQNIVKHFGKDSEGYRDIADALSAMTGIAHHINEMKRRHEHAIRVQEIQSLLYGWEGEDLTTYGELCAEGAFRMHGAKALRHAFLFDRMLLLTKRKEEGMLTYKAHILCSNLMLIESIPGEPLSFHVIPFDNPRLQYTLQARNLEQKREWTLQLKRVILENYNAVIPTHARQLVMELGQNRTDDEIMAEKSAPKKQHSAPEYLERRKQERRKSETGLLLRTRLRRSHRKEGTVAMQDGLSYEESPTVYRRGRRAQSVSQERSEICSRGVNSEEHRAGTLPSTAEKVKDRFGSWRRKSEPSYSSKSNSSIGHLSIYVSPDFIERSTDSLVNGERKVDISMEEENRGNKQNVEVVSQNEHSIKMKDGPPKSEKMKSVEDELDSETNDEKEDGGSHEESLEEIVGQLVMQSHQFQRMLMRHHRRAQGGSTIGGTVTNRSRNHSREHQRNGETSSKDSTMPQNEEQYEQPGSEACTHNSGGENHSNTLKQSMSTFRAQRQAHMRALRQEQRVSVIMSQNKNKVQKEESSQCDNSTPYITLTFDNGILKTADGVSMEGIANEEISNHQINKTEGYLGNYDNLQNVWESVRQVEKEMKAVSPDSSFSSHKEENSPWPSPGLEPCIPTLPAVWLKQQEGHLAIPSLKSGSLPRGFQLGRPQQQAHRCTTFEVAYPSSTLPHFEGSGNNDEGYPSSLFRMERPFTIASESPGRADEIDFEDIEQYMAETGRTGTGMSFLPSRFPLPPLQDGQEVCQEEEDEEEEDNSSTAHIHVHPEYRIYRPSVSRAALRHVISSVSSKLANFRAGAASGGVTTEDEEEEREMEDLVGEVREKSNQRGRTRRRIGNSCPNSLDSNDVYRSGHVSGGDSESEVVKGGSRLVYTLARHYSRSLKERIRSIMTMNVVGMGNIDQDDQDFKVSELEGQSLDHFVSQDNLSNRTSPVKTPTTPPVTYHKQGSSSLGARIAHGGDLPEYATPHIRGVNDKTKDNLSSRPDSLLSVTSTFTSSSNGDKVHEDRASTSISKSEPQCDEINSNRKICRYEEEEEYCGGSGDSYYERSFEAIESFLGDPGMGCTIIGDTYRDSAIFSDHEEVDILVSRASEHCKTSMTLQKGSNTTNRSKIPPPVPAKPTASSIAASSASLTNPDRICKELPHLDTVKSPVLEKGHSVQGKEHNSMGGFPIELQTHLMGIKSVQERRMELEMRKSSTDVSGCCSGNNGMVEDVSKHVRQNGEGYVETGKLVDCDAIDSARDSENGNDGVTMPKGWVRHVIGKLQGD